MCSVIMLNTIGTYINNTLENLVYTIVSGNKMVVEIIPAAGNVPDYDEQGNIIIPESQLISPEKLQEVEQNYMGDVEQIIELPSLAYYTNNAEIIDIFDEISLKYDFRIRDEKEKTEILVKKQVQRRLEDRQKQAERERLREERLKNRRKLSASIEPITKTKLGKTVEKIKKNKNKE